MHNPLSIDDKLYMLEKIGDGPGVAACEGCAFFMDLENQEDPDAEDVCPRKEGDWFRCTNRVDGRLVFYIFKEVVNGDA